MSGKGATVPVIQFYEVDSDTFEDIPLGIVTVDESGNLAASTPDLLVLAESAGGSVAEVIEKLSDWSNGYLRSERVA
jgi:hypothetical protein